MDTISYSATTLTFLTLSLSFSGANPNALDPRGRSCLKLALRYAVSARPVIELLVAAKAEVYSCRDRLAPATTASSCSATTSSIGVGDTVTGSSSAPRTLATEQTQTDAAATSTPTLLTTDESRDAGTLADADSSSRPYPNSPYPASDKTRNKIHSMLEDELSALAQASAGEDCDVGVIEYLVTNAYFPNSSIKQKTLDFALFYACQKGTGRICRTLMSLMVWGPDGMAEEVVYVVSVED